MFYDMTWLERILFLKRIKGSGNPMHEATSTSGSFFTDMVAPLKKLLLTLEPIQSGSGTPSPDNVRPISGHTEVVTEVCGKNFFNGSFNAVTPFALHKAVTVCASAELNGASYGVLRTYDENQTFIASTLLSTGSGSRRYGNITLSEKVRYVKFEASGGTLTDMMIETGTVMTDYEPYNGNTYTTTLGRTVYGGSVDIVTGECVIDRAIHTFDGTETWTKSSAGNVYYLTTDATVFPYGKDHASYNISDKYVFNGFAPGGYNSFLNDGEYLLYEWGGSSLGIREIAFKNESITSVADWKALLQSNPIQVVYELATPQTYQLDPQQINSLVGQNNIITEDGVEVSEIVYMTRLVGSPQTEEEEANEEPVEESEEVGEDG